MKINGTVTRVIYQEEYGKGEVEDTRQESIIGRLQFDSVKEGLEWFKKEFGVSEDAKLKYEPSLHGDNVPTFIAPGEMQVLTPKGLYDASYIMIEEWKRGEFELYHIEHQLTLAVEIPYTVENFNAETDIPADLFENFKK